MLKKLLGLTTCFLLLTAESCDAQPDADAKMAAAQKISLAEAQAEVGMPAITNYQEKRMLKQIYEMRDQTISTQSYIVNSMRGCLVYLGQSVGYGVPYAAQYSASQAFGRLDSSLDNSYIAYGQKPQAEPNGLFMPASAEGTWINLLNPETKKTQVVYIEPQVIVSPFRLTAQECK